MPGNRRRSVPEPAFFATAKEFRAWLAKNAGKAPELQVGFFTVGSARPSIRWPEAVDEALCVGWIDGMRKRIDDNAYQIRFTPRRPGSIWSAINIAKAKALITAGRMKASGLEAYERRIEQKSRVYSYEQDEARALAPNEIRAFKKSKVAWAYFEKLPPGHRRTLLHWITSAKHEETRSRRLARFIESCAAGRRLLP